MITAIKKWKLLALATPLVYLTGSSTAYVLLVVWLALWWVSLVPESWKPFARMAAIGTLAIMLLTLPQIVARYDALDSLWGRLENASDYAAHPPSLPAMLFGKGLGIGSNVLNSLVLQSDSYANPNSVDMFHVRADSTPMALLNQIGVVGVLAFYLLLFGAAWRDRQALPVYVIIFLSGMTINVLELFPMNFLLGLLLCRSAYLNYSNAKAK